MPFTPQHLSNAPILEAMIAFDFAPQLSNSTALLDRFYDAIRSDYPVRNAIQVAAVTFDPNGSSVGKTDTVGARFTSSEGKRVCAINNNSFICSRLQPYETWESLREEFVRLWNLYSSLEEMQVTKVAVRYINKLFVPEGRELSESVSTFPKIADGLPQGMFNIWVRLELRIPEPLGTLIVTEVQLPPERPERVAIILDHDLQFPVLDREADIWSILERARELKNRYFFASISDELLQEYL